MHACAWCSISIIIACEKLLMYVATAEYMGLLMTNVCHKNVLVGHLYILYDHVHIYI